MIYKINGEIFTCPMGRFTGEEEDSYEMKQCAYCDCSDVSENREYELYGQTYHCDYEKRRIEHEHQRVVKQNKEVSDMENAFIHMSDMNMKNFMTKCGIINQALLRNRRPCDEEFCLYPFPREGRAFIVYVFDGEEIKEIGACTNILAYLLKRLEAIRNNSDFGFSYESIPATETEEILATLQIMNGFDAVQNITMKNAVYIKNNQITKYVSYIYGMQRHEFMKMKRKHKLTEKIVSGEVVYLKKEIDNMYEQERSNNKKQGKA